MVYFSALKHYSFWYTSRAERVKAATVEHLTGISYTDIIATVKEPMLVSFQYKHFRGR